jgi:hypothetical protein
MQAGLVPKRLSFRKILVAVPAGIIVVIVFVDVTVALRGINEQKMAA